MSRLLIRAAKRVTRAVQKHRFDAVAQNILDTRPLILRGGTPNFVSLVCHRDIASYLLAIKSLYVRIRRGKVTVINDGSLSSKDIAVLNCHLPGIQIIDLHSISVGTSPRADFFWERLMKVVELSRDDYVIQLDADTLVSGDIPEVVNAWQSNRSFLLGTASGRAITTAPTTANMVRGWIEANGWQQLSVGTEAESLLDQLPNSAERRYVHASAGFAGFACGAVCGLDVERFSEEMANMLGRDRWTEWGSEQIISNYILANTRGTIVLPFPRYACFEPHVAYTESAFLHFIGTHRYSKDIYRCRAAAFISEYNRTGQSSPIEESD